MRRSVTTLQSIRVYMTIISILCRCLEDPAADLAIEVQSVMAGALRVVMEQGTVFFFKHLLKMTLKIDSITPSLLRFEVCGID